MVKRSTPKASSQRPRKAANIAKALEKKAEALRSGQPPPSERVGYRAHRTTLCYMDVSVRKLRNHTGRVIAAIEGGEPVVLTVHGRPVADIVPRRTRSERRPSELLVADLNAISQLASELNVTSDAIDFDTGLTTDDMVG